MFQTFRRLDYKSRGLDDKQTVELRSAILNPSPAKDVTEVEEKIAKWKADIRKMVSIDPQSIRTSDRV